MKNIRLIAVKNILLIFLSVAFIISTLMIFHEKKQDKRQYEHFLNRFYFQLDDTIASLEYALTIKDPEKQELLTSAMYKIEKNLEETHLTLEMGDLFLDKNIRTSVHYFMNRGIPLFANDGKLTVEEEAFLLKMKENLEFIRQGMYSEETGQEDPNLNVDTLNELISEIERSRAR
ncbi:MAG: hypothetical protein H0Z32_04390 [Bacillaceae bacterium]|nr:hypothetical protein [Bacillaceae bacterium]